MSSPIPNRVRLGLTGGIGSGKSTVAAVLQQLGATLIDADAISRASTAAGGPAMPAIREAFGDDFLTAEGALNRDRMRTLVFTDPQAKAKLEGITHPIIRAEIDRHCNAVQRGCVVLDMPLLVESRAWRERVDTIWVVDCSRETQIARVIQRNGWARAQVEAVLAAQASREQRLALANTVIDNDQTTLAQLDTQVRAAYAQLQQRYGL